MTDYTKTLQNLVRNYISAGIARESKSSSDGYDECALDMYKYSLNNFKLTLGDRPWVLVYKNKEGIINNLSGCGFTDKLMNAIGDVYSHDVEVFKIGFSETDKLGNC